MRNVIEQLAEFDTALLANTIEHLSAEPPEDWYMDGSIRSVTPNLGPTVGIAVTCELDSSTPGGTADVDAFWAQLEQIEGHDTPVVWIVKTGGSRPAHECVMGDGMAKLLCAAGCAGLITNGGVRDVPGLMATPFAAYCSGTVIHHTPLRFRCLGEPVELGGIRIKSGDVIHANAEGVIRVPQDSLEALPDKLIVMRSVEHDVHRFWRRTDISLQEKRVYAMEAYQRNGFVGRSVK